MCLLFMSHVVLCQLVQTIVGAARLISLSLCMNGSSMYSLIREALREELKG